MKRFMLAMLVAVCYATPSIAQWSYADGFAEFGGERFFPIGTWGIPDVSFDGPPDSGSEETAYDYYIGHFNMLYVGSYDWIESYMDEADIKYVIGGTGFKWRIETDYDHFSGEAEYNIEIPNYNPVQDGYFSYSEAETLKVKVDTDQEIAFFDSIISDVRTFMGDRDYVWGQLDEPDMYYGSWSLHPDILTAYKNRIFAAASADTLIWTSFSPKRKGNRYWYEYHSMTPPPDDNVPYSDYEYRGFSDNTNSGNDVYISKFVQNTWDTAAAYSTTGNIFGLNDYWAFDTDPAYAAKATDALKWGTSNSNPVWLWFATHFSGTSTTSDAYKKIRCQVYTAITQGCTGIFFYSLEANPYQFGTIAYLANELRDLLDYGPNNENILTASCVDNGVLPNGVHYLIRYVTGGGGTYLILTNPTGDDDLVVTKGNFDGNFDIAGSDTTWCLDSHEAKVIDDTGTTLYKPAISQNDNSVMIEKPESYTVSAAPNPFNPSTTISYSIPNATRVKITVYSISGQQIRTLVNGVQDAGTHAVIFDGADLPSGIYLYRFETGEYQTTGKMTLMK